MPSNFLIFNAICWVVNLIILLFSLLFSRCISFGAVRSVKNISLIIQALRIRRVILLLLLLLQKGWHLIEMRWLVRRRVNIRILHVWIRKVVNKVIILDKWLDTFMRGLIWRSRWRRMSVEFYRARRIIIYTWWAVIRFGKSIDISYFIIHIYWFQHWWLLVWINRGKLLSIQFLFDLIINVWTILFHYSIFLLSLTKRRHFLIFMISLKLVIITYSTFCWLAIILRQMNHLSIL